jgi:hypothetical protein
LRVGQIVHQHNRMTLLQVIGHNGLELLLTRRVPYAQSNCRVVDIYDALVKFDCDCRGNRSGKEVGAEVGMQQVSLA